MFRTHNSIIHKRKLNETVNNNIGAIVFWL